MWIGRHRWWRAALLTVLAVAGVVVAASWVILRVWGPAFTRERVEALLGDALGQPARVGAVHLSPWRARLSVIDVEVPARPGPPGGLSLRAAAIDVSVDIASLWRRELVVSGLARDLRLELTVAGTSTGGPGIWPIPQYIQFGPLRIGIGRLRIKASRAVIRHPETAFAIEFTGADVTAAPDAGDLQVSSRIETLRVEALGRSEQFDRVALDGRLSPDGVLIRQAGWRWRGEGMHLEGEVRHPWVAAREIFLRVKGDISLAALAKTAGLDLRLAGKARIAAEITGPASAPRIGGQVRIPELGLAGITAREISIDGQWAEQALRLDDIRARFGTGRLRGRLEATPVSAGGARVALELGEVVLPGVLAGLGPGTAIAEGMIRDGGIDLRRAKANWRGLSASLDGRIAAGPSLAMRADLSADVRELGRVMSWGPTSGQASVSAELTGRGPTPTLTGRAEIAGLVVAGRPVEPSQAAFRLTASPGPESRWEGTVQAPRVRWDRVAVEDIAASLAVDGKQVQLTRARARVAAVPVEATGRWQWLGSGQGHAALGPISLGGITGVPASLRIGGYGRATVDASIERGVASANALVELDQVSAAGLTLGAGRSEVRVRGRTLETELSFPARRFHATAAGRLEASGTLTGRVELDDLALAPLLRELGSAAADHVEGRVSGRGELVIPLSQPASGRAVVRLMPDGLRLLGESWSSQGPIVLRWEDRRLLVDRLRLDGPAGSLSASGTFAGPDGRGVSLALDNGRLPGVLAGLGRGTARAEVRLDDGGLELTRFEARWPRIAAVASGRLRGDGSIELAGRADAELAGLGPVLGLPGADGRVALSADARGPVAAIEASGSLRASRIQLRGATLSDVEVPFRFSRSILRVDRARARLGASQISAEASAAWTRVGSSSAGSPARDVQMKAEVRAPTVRLEDLAPLLPTAFRGRGTLALAARAEGTTRAWRGSGTLASPLVELGAGPLRQLRAVLALDQTGLEVTELRVNALGVPAHATARWAWAGGGRATAALGPASLETLTIVPATLGLRGTGRAAIEASMRTPADVAGAAHVVLEDVAAGAVRLGRATMDVAGKDGVLRADIAVPDLRLRATGGGRIDAGGTLSAEATMPEIDLEPLARALSSPAALAGTVAVRATARVPLAEPRRGEGVLSIGPARLVVGGQAWEGQGPIEVRWTQGGLSLAAFKLATKEGVVSVTGALGADGKLDARATAQVPLAMLGGIRPEIREIGGIIELSLRASGSLSAPIVVGDGAIHHGTLLLRDRPETLREVEARASLSSQGLQLREATGLLGGGRVQARGDLVLRGWQPREYRMQLHAQNISVGRIEDFVSVWDADLELSGFTRQAQLQGRARLVSGVYTRDLSILSIALSPNRPPVAETGTVLRLRVRVDLDENLVVRSRVADLRAGGVLSVEGTTARPILFGSVESRDGRIRFRGREWSVASATVRFADPRRLDPILDVLATSRIGEYDVTMQITGPVSSVNVRFSSTPRLSQNDLLSLVAFGVTGAGLQQSPATVLLGEAGKFLAQNVLGIDPGTTGLSVSTGSTADRAGELHGFPGEERSGAARNTTAGRRETVRVEYQLWAPLFLSGEYDRAGGYGTDVILRFRFR